MRGRGDAAAQAHGGGPTRAGPFRTAYISGPFPSAGRSRRRVSGRRRSEVHRTPELRMSHLRRVWFVVLIILSGAALLRAQAPDLSALDAYIEEARRAWGIPALAIAIVHSDSVIFARGYGVREYGRDGPVDEHTLFAFASTTKAFIAAALGMLVDEGVVDWDDPVRCHLPGFELGDPYVSRHVTIRDLLTHRVGVAREDNVWIAAPFDPSELVR